MIKRKLKEFTVEKNNWTIPSGTDAQLIACEIDNSFLSGVKVSVKIPFENGNIILNVDSSIILSNVPVYES